MYLNSLEQNYIQHWVFLFQEYEKVKYKYHPFIGSVMQFFQIYHIPFKKFYALYKIYRSDSNLKALLPKMKGIKKGNYKVLTTDIIEKILFLRQENGFSIHQIFHFLKENTNPYPSFSTIYKLLKAKNLNKMDAILKTQKAKHTHQIIYHQLGGLGHIDIHIIKNAKGQYHKYLIGLLDDSSRLVELKALDSLSKDIVAEAVQSLLLQFQQKWAISFVQILSDNGKDFGGGPEKNNKTTFPFELILKNHHIRHKYTSIQTPECNGKIERFWHTIETEFFYNHTFSSMSDFENRLKKYLFFYNHCRPHMGLNNQAPCEYYLKKKHANINLSVFL